MSNPSTSRLNSSSPEQRSTRSASRRSGSQSRTTPQTSLILRQRSGVIGCHASYRHVMFAEGFNRAGYSDFGFSQFFEASLTLTLNHSHIHKRISSGNSDIRYWESRNLKGWQSADKRAVRQLAEAPGQGNGFSAVGAEGIGNAIDTRPSGTMPALPALTCTIANTSVTPEAPPGSGLWQTTSEVRRTRIASPGRTPAASVRIHGQ